MIGIIICRQKYEQNLLKPSHGTPEVMRQRSGHVHKKHSLFAVRKIYIYSNNFATICRVAIVLDFIQTVSIFDP